MPEVELAPHNPYGLRLRAPVMTAAGCFGFGVEYERIASIEQLGAIVTGSISLHGRRALPPPSFIETPAGLLSVAGWRDPGLDRVLREYAPAWAAWKTPVILGVAADYVAIAGDIERVEGIAGLELSFTHSDAAALTKTIAAVRAVTLLPLLVKLPLHDGLAATARAVLDAGANALTIAAPPRAAAPHPHSGELLFGRLSGPALRPLVLAAIADLHSAIGAPIIACGGVVSAADARAYLAAGAAAVQVGSALLADPQAAARIAAELD